MKVYKGYLIALKTNISTVILYGSIYLLVALSMVYLSSGEKNSGSYSQQRLSIGVVDRDSSLWSETLLEYLKQYHDVTVMEDDMSTLAEAVYSSEIVYAVLIPEDFLNTCILGEESVGTLTESGSQWEYYVNGRIDSFVLSLADSSQWIYDHAGSPVRSIFCRKHGKNRRSSQWDGQRIKSRLLLPGRNLCATGASDRRDPKARSVFPHLLVCAEYFNPLL